MIKARYSNSIDLDPDLLCGFSRDAGLLAKIIRPRVSAACLACSSPCMSIYRRAEGSSKKPNASTSDGPCGEPSLDTVGRSASSPT
jgi:hypothetical protein